jgi:hypothetical protein
MTHGNHIYAQINNPDVLGTRSLVDVFKHDFWGQAIGLADSHKSYRPITTFSFRLNHSIHGLKAMGYHAGNVIIFAVSSALVFEVQYSTSRLFWSHLLLAPLFLLLLI